VFQSWQLAVESLPELEKNRLDYDLVAHRAQEFFNRIVVSQQANPVVKQEKGQQSADYMPPAQQDDLPF
jgi:hypothetical protein